MHRHRDRKYESLNPIFEGKSFVIAGPCALESLDTAREVALVLKSIADEFFIPVVFKGSYTKANRTRLNSFHGLGLARGLDLLRQVKEEYGIAVTSDVHEICEVEPAAEVLDILQIPALLCKNTRLLTVTGGTGKIVNIKKGHFINASDMRYSVEKVASTGNAKILVTERGNSFGYHDTIVDFRSINVLKSLGYPVVFDATHSVRNISRRSEDPEGGTPEAIPLLTRCAAVAGANGLFIETHPSPEEALCDATVSCPLERLRELVRDFIALRNFLQPVKEEAVINDRD